VSYAGLDTDDVCACYQKYKSEPSDSNRDKLCRTLWEHVQPDKERPDSVTVGGVLVIIDFQQYVVLVDKQECGCRSKITASLIIGIRMMIWDQDNDNAAASAV
jgi:hypothetical protein